MKAVLGTKIGMTSLFDELGKVHPATIVYVDDNYVLDVKTKEKDGYNAVQVGYETIKDKNSNKPLMGIFKKAKSEPKRFIKELKDVEGYNVGDKFGCEVFEPGQYVDVQGYTKGHGFTGSIKRHNFSVGPLGHGAGYPHRYIGSICGGRGGSQAQRVFKGKKMPGHYGHEIVTMSNLVILDVIPEKRLLVINGSIPGPEKGVVRIKLSKRYLNKKSDIKLFTNTSLKTKATTDEVANNDVNGGEING